MPGPIANTDSHTDSHTDAERVTDQGAHMDRIPNDILRPFFRAVNAWWDTIDNSDDERDPAWWDPIDSSDDERDSAQRDLIRACRYLLAYVDGEQQRDADAERDAELERERDADEPDPEWVTDLVANVRRAADAAERIAECLYSHQREPEHDPDAEPELLRRAYRLGCVRVGW